ncbi:methyl-accepting chemotaxis protein [Bdellovibrio sp. HCB209]|uniref:HAMP domain-containing methyl-accepting chemotaxis protein n=1 Tax=Bdellovibrio sp. HCB209 TaxID=3394354 RepID=UPI0039B389BD
MANLSLKAKLLFLTLILCGVSVVIGITSYISLTSVSTEYGWIATKTLPKMDHLDQMYLNYRKIRINLRTLGLPNLPTEQASHSIDGVIEAINDYEKQSELYVGLGFIPGQKELYDNLQAAWVDFKKTGVDVLQYQKSGTPEDKAKMLDIFFKDCPQKAEVYTKAVSALSKFHHDAADAKVKSAESIRDKANLIVMMMVIGGTLFGCLFGLLFSTSLSKTLNRISQEIFGAASHTAAGGAQLASASAQLSTGATEAAASLEETVASIEELSSMVKLNTSHAQEANTLSKNSRESAEKGFHEIERLIAAMNEISHGSKKIEEIIQVIDDIAFQTNLLALNASVEAARAGEQGKGFAVVADAVRTLAQKSAESAKGINSLIKDNVEKTENGASIASNSGVVLKEILTSVKKVADLNGEISAGSTEQATGIEQISKAMNQLDQATQGNAASSEEVAASSEEMSAQAQALSGLVGELQILVNGTKKTTESSHITSAARTSEAVAV